MRANEKKKKKREKSKSLGYNRLILALSNHSPSSFIPYIYSVIKIKAIFLQFNVLRKRLMVLVMVFIIIVHYTCYYIQEFGCHTTKFPLSAKLNMQYRVHTTWLTVYLLVYSCLRACEYRSTQIECDNRNSVVMKKWTQFFKMQYNGGGLPTFLFSSYK